MKIIVVKKAVATKKPQSFCPWMEDELTERKK
jgi:hypothetical protein